MSRRGEREEIGGGRIELLEDTRRIGEEVEEEGDGAEEELLFEGGMGGPE